jgi:hypothetical protein
VPETVVLAPLFPGWIGAPLPLEQAGGGEHSEQQTGPQGGWNEDPIQVAHSDNPPEFAWLPRE